MESIVVKEITRRQDIRAFIKFPNQLFKDVPTYIPPLMNDEMSLLTDKNPSLDHCDLKLWLAYRGKQIVGRVAGIKRPYVSAGSISSRITMYSQNYLKQW